MARSLSRKKRRKSSTTLDEAAWEAVCRRCARCCHERTITPDGDVVAWGAPCPYLDVATRQCGAYDQRFELGVDCRKVTPRAIRKTRFLPPGCAYRELDARELDARELDARERNARELDARELDARERNAEDVG